MLPIGRTLKDHAAEEDAGLAWGMWFNEEEELWHIIPLNDLKQHDDSMHCFCCPDKEGNDESEVRHNSVDGREDFEDGIRKFS